MRFIELHLASGKRLLLNASAVVSVEEWQEGGEGGRALINIDGGERYHVLETYDEVVEVGVGKSADLEPLYRFNPERVISLVYDPLVGDKTDVCLVSVLGAQRLSKRSAEALMKQLQHILREP